MRKNRNLYKLPSCVIIRMWFFDPEEAWNYRPWLEEYSSRAALHRTQSSGMSEPQMHSWRSPPRDWLPHFYTSEKKTPQKQRVLSNFTQYFIEESRLEIRVPISENKLRLIEVELLAPKYSATKRQGGGSNLI